MKKSRRFRPGDAVWLRPFEDQPWQPAVILEIPRRIGQPYTVEVNKEAREADDPDGLREVPADQLAWTKE